MKRRGFLAGLGCTAVWPLAAHSQPPASAARIGWITAQQAASLTPYVDAFRASLADLGLVEGRNLIIVFRYGNDAIERVPQLAAELERIPVDLIVAQGASDRAANGIRACYQSQDRQGTRHHDTALNARPRRRSDRIGRPFCRGAWVRKWGGCARMSALPATAGRSASPARATATRTSRRCCAPMSPYQRNRCFLINDRNYPTTLQCVIVAQCSGH